VGTFKSKWFTTCLLRSSSISPQPPGAAARGHGTQQAPVPFPARPRRREDDKSDGLLGNRLHLTRKATAWWFFSIPLWRPPGNKLLSPLGDAAAGPRTADGGFACWQQCRFLPEVLSVLKRPEVNKPHLAGPARSPRVHQMPAGWKAYGVPCPESWTSSISGARRGRNPPDTPVKARQQLHTEPLEGRDFKGLATNHSL